MSAIDVLLAGPLAAMTVGGVAFSALGAVCVRLWLGKKSTDSEPRNLPPVTLLRPVKAGVPSLREKLCALAQAMRPGDQLVLGAEQGSPELAVCDAVGAGFQDREIVVVPCAPGAAVNPKISKLVQVDGHARHGHLILSDSEAFIDAAWLDAFRVEWAASGADVLTAPYRFVGFATLAECADAAATLLSFWPGLALVRALGQVRFTLGACTGLHRDALAKVGGWTAFGDFLAEDNRLGAALAEHGARIRLSAQVASLESDPMNWRDFWRHQRRVAVTHRVCDPRGFAGLIVTHGITAAFLMILLAPVSASPGFWLVWAIVALACRGLSTRVIAAAIRMPVPGLWRAIGVAGMLETASWVLSWCVPTVWWAGKWRAVSWDGRMRGESGG
jgi:ceramide glucosyltransferase